MIPINIKSIVKPLDQAEIKYETEIILIEEPVRHKHIRIYKEDVIDRSFIKDVEHNWYEGECDICPK